MIADVHLIPLLMAVFATYRVAYMITSEEGPFGLAAGFRSLFDRFGRDRRTSWLTNGVNCVLCVSFWLALIPTGYFVWLWWLPWPAATLTWLGIAGGVVFVAKLAR